MHSGRIGGQIHNLTDRNRNGAGRWSTGFAASRVAGVILPFTFKGRRHREREGAFADAPPLRLGAFVAPLRPGSGAGGVAGPATAFRRSAPLARGARYALPPPFPCWTGCGGATAVGKGSGALGMPIQQAT